MFSLNKIQIIGRIGGDAETKVINENFSVTSFSVATSHSWLDKNKERQTETTWHNVKVPNANSYIKDNIRKGMNIYVEGRLRKFEYEKDGVKHYGVEIVASHIVFVEKSIRNEEPAGEVPETENGVNGDLPF